MRTVLLTVSLLLIFAAACAADTWELWSPDGKIRIRIDLGNGLRYSVRYEGQVLLEPAYMQLIGSIPTVWDTTIVAAAALGDYIVTARKKAGEWFIDSMTDWLPRQLAIPLAFLDHGRYEVTYARTALMQTAMHRTTAYDCMKWTGKTRCTSAWRRAVAMWRG